MKTTSDNSKRNDEYGMISLARFVAIILLILSSLFAIFGGTTIAFAQQPQANQMCFTVIDTPLLFGPQTKDVQCLPDAAACTQARIGAGPNTDHHYVGPCVAATAGNQQAVTPTEAVQQAAELANSTIERSSGKFGDGFLDDTIGQVLEGIAHLIFWAASVFMTGMGLLLDHSIRLSINSDIFKALSVINVGWTVMRDFANMLFIFVLLYIAITTILGMAGHNTKTMLRNVIIVALLINFSLYITQVVIDTGNVVAVTFFDRIETQQGDKMMKGPSAALKQGLDLQTILSTGKESATLASLSHSKMALIWAGGAVLMFIAGYVFFAGALMMIIRSIALIFLMIFSPLAFIGFIIPKAGGQSQKWWSSLLSNTMLAPVFLIMIYLVVLIIQSNDLTILTQKTDKDQFGAFLSGGIDSFAIFYNYIILCGLMIACLKVASSVSSSTASMATKWASRGTGMIAGATIGTVALGGRQIIGKAGQVAAENPWLQKKAQTSSLARLATNVSDKAAKSSFDLRGSKVGAGMLGATLGTAGISAGSAGGQGGLKKTGTIWNKGTLGRRGYAGTEKEEEVVKKAQTLFPANPIAQQAYIRDHTGTKVVKKEIVDEPTGITYTGRVAEKRLDVTESLKKEKDRLGREIVVVQAKDNIKKQLEVLKKPAEETSRKLTQNEAKELGVKEGLTAGEAAKEIISTSMGKLSGKEAEKILKEGNEHVIQAAQRQHLVHMNANPADFSPEVFAKTNEIVMASGRDDARQYLIQQAKLKSGLFQTDLKKELNKRIDTYDKEREQIESRIKTAVGEEGEHARKELAELDEKHDTAVQDILGGMGVKEAAQMKDTKIKSHKTLVRNYTNKHFDEIESHHKNIVQDTNNPATREMFKTIRTNAEENGTKSTRKYMSEAKRNPASLYYDPNAAPTGKTAQQTNKINAELNDIKNKRQEALAKGTGDATTIPELNKREEVLKKELDTLKQKEAPESKKDTATESEEEEENEKEEGAA